MGREEPTRIAIGCQGGGSHSAFTAGVLETVIERVAERADRSIVALSGTSGGAMCATLAWYGLLEDDPALTGELLGSFWDEMVADDPSDALSNLVAVSTARVRERGFPVPEISPYDNPLAEQAQDRLRNTVARLVDFEAIDALRTEASPEIAIGAVDITGDDFRVFDGAEISPEALVASSAVPDLFPAVHVDGGIYWDGLLSENPPIDALTDANPDEIWVIQLDAREIREEPRTLREITDRRNELAGNLSLDQEIRTIEKVNAMIERGVLDHPDYRPITVRRLVMDDELDYPSKLDRTPAFIERLMDHGREQARAFLDRSPGDR